MTQPNMPNLPGFAAMADMMEFIKNMWGGAKMPSAGIPGMVMPTLSVEEINKQVADLKAVESWLSLNMNMLRATIQALEVQSATIATLRSMGDTFGANLKPDAAPPADAPEQKTAATASDPLYASALAGAPTAWWNLLQEQFNQTVNSVMAEEEKKKAKPGVQKTKPVRAKAAPSKSTARPRKRPPAAKA